MSRLRKDDGDEDSEDDDDSGSDEKDDSDSGDSDFDSKYPRWAAGSPGGEFAPRDSGDALSALHEAISEDAKTPIPLDPNSARAALTSGLDKRRYWMMACRWQGI